MENLMRVANVKTLSLKLDETGFYVGRGRVPQLLEYTGLGNPFIVGAEYRQGEAAAAYLPYLREKYLEKGHEYTMINKMAALVRSGKKIVLVCWCDPKPCHAQAIKKAVLGVAMQETK